MLHISPAHIQGLELDIWSLVLPGSGQPALQPEPLIARGHYHFTFPPLKFASYSQNTLGWFSWPFPVKSIRVSGSPPGVTDSPSHQGRLWAWSYCLHHLHSSEGASGVCCLFAFKDSFTYFREREREHSGEEQRESKRETQAHSMPSIESDIKFNLTYPRSWPEWTPRVKCLNHCATQVPPGERESKQAPCPVWASHQAILRPCDHDLSQDQESDA